MEPIDKLKAAKTRYAKALENIQVEIKPHPRFPDTHKRVIVTTPRGYAYFADWAEPFPTVSDVKRIWADKDQRKRTFQPYRG